MLTPDEQSDRLNKAQLRAHGEDIIYTPAGGGAIALKALLRRPAIGQSTPAGYFATIEIDPTVIEDPRRGDMVTWVDGVQYVVTHKVNTPYGLTAVEIHRRDA